MRRNLAALREGISVLRRHGRVILEMARGDLTGRYKGQWFGSAWVIIHPLASTLLYLFLFGVVFAQRMGGTRELPLDYTTYLLAGLIPWLTFQTAMTTSVLSITGNATLVKQFLFPVEVLPIRDVVASTVTWIIGVSATLLYVVFSQKLAMVTWLLLPLVFSLQMAAMIGVALILSAIAVFFRDIRDLVALFCLVAMFLMPIVYLPSSVPPAFQPVLWANPFTYMVWVYQDTIYFGRFEHAWAWLIFTGWSVLVFVAGFRLFSSTRPLFASLV
jgi:homopolymeric O-antigen transport system permease protein